MDNVTGIPILHTPVLIVGSSMVGMTLSALLAKHGLQGCITVERHASTAVHPRAALFHPRSMEIYREMGLYEEMRAKSAEYYDENAGIVDVESLAGRFIQSWMANMNEGIENLSPTGRLFLTQHMFEPILRRKAVSHGASLHFSTEMLSFQQDPSGVTALIRSIETGEKKLVRAKYLVACDGNRSGVRAKLGIKVKGHGLLSHSLTIYFKADVEKFIRGKYNGVIYINNPTVRGFIRIDKSGKQGFLVVNTAGKQGTEESRFPADTITDERAGELLRAAFGADVDFEIELVAKWRAVCDNAERYNSGRVLLAGDAAHTVTPHGGFGGNTGIQDAHNLAWKLALVLKGQAGPELAERTYHDERHPVGQKTVNQVFERYVKRTAPELASTAKNLEDEIPEPHLELGYRYHSKALMTTELGELTENPLTATARLGSKAPHVMISTGNKENISISDLFDGNFVLLLGESASEWEAAASKLPGEDLQLPQIKAHRIHGREFNPRYGISPSGGVLVRPDGFVAWKTWREPVPDVDATDTIRSVMRRILCLDDSQSPEENPNQMVNGLSTFQGTIRTQNSVATSLSAALFEREKDLRSEKARLLQRAEEIDVELVDLKRMGELESEMAMLAMKLMPVADRPPEYSFSECLKRRERW